MMVGLDHDSQVTQPRINLLCIFLFCTFSMMYQPLYCSCYQSPYIIDQYPIESLLLLLMLLLPLVVMILMLSYHHRQEHFMCNKQALAARLMGGDRGGWGQWADSAGIDSPGLAAITAAAEIHSGLGSLDDMASSEGNHYYTGGSNNQAALREYSPCPDGGQNGLLLDRLPDIDDEEVYPQHTAHAGRQPGFATTTSAFGAFSPVRLPFSSLHRRKRGTGDEIDHGETGKNSLTHSWESGVTLGSGAASRSSRKNSEMDANEGDDGGGVSKSGRSVKFGKSQGGHGGQKIGSGSGQSQPLSRTGRTKRRSNSADSVDSGDRGIYLIEANDLHPSENHIYHHF